MWYHGGVWDGLETETWDCERGPQDRPVPTVLVRGLVVGVCPESLAPSSTKKGVTLWVLRWSRDLGELTGKVGW